MNAGMLWFDNDPKKTLDTKIAEAARHFRDKYGATPDYCLVNPKSAGSLPEKAGGVTVQASRVILPGHLWIGTDDSKN